MSDNPEVRIDATLATDNVQAQTARLISEMSRLADAINEKGARASSGLSDTSRHADGLSDAFKHVGEEFEQAFSAKAVLGEVAHGFLAIAGPIAIVEAGLDAIREVIGEIREFSKEGIIKSDELRDLGLSLNIIERSAIAGSEAFERMEGAAEKTRNIGDELIATYRRLEPLASSRGFSHEELQNVTVMLSQLATIRGTDFEAMAGGFQQLLAGRVSAGRNPLLAALGITKADINDLGWDQIIAKMDQVAAHFPEFGQSFESVLTKIKEDLLVTFAEGFAGARGEAMSGMEALRHVLADPALREDIRSLGSLIAGLVGHAGDFANAMGGVVTALQKVPSLPPWLLPLAPALFPSIAMAAAGEAKAKQEQADLQASASKGWQGRYFMHGLGFNESFQTPGFRDSSELYGKVSESLSSMTIKGQGELVRGLTVAMKDHILTAKEYEAAEFKAFEADAPKGKVKIDDLTGSMDKLRAAYNKAGAELDVLTIKQEAAGRVSETRYSSFAAEIRYREQLSQDRKQEIVELDALNEAAVKLGAGGAYRAFIEAVKSDNSEGIDKTLGALSNLNPALADAAERFKDVREQNDALARDVMLASSSIAFQQWVSKLNLTPAGWTHSVGSIFDAGGGIVQTDPSLLLPARGAGINSLTSQLALTGGLAPATSEDMQLWRTVGKAIGDSARRQLLDEQFISQFGDSFASIFSNGGRDFLRTVGGGMSDLLRLSGQEFSTYLFGTKGVVGQRDATGAFQLVTHRYDAQGNDITGRATDARAALGVAQIGIGSYDAVLQGASRSSATLNAGLAGAGLGASLAAGTGFAAMGATGAVAGGIVGAIAGLIVGAIGAALATAEKQAQYKYGIPGIDATGHATFTSATNYTDADTKAIVRRIQETYDTIHDSLARTLMKLDGVILPVMAAINGQFQPAASGHFQQHLEAYLAGTEGDEIFKQFKPQMDAVGAALGFGVNKWNQIMSDLDLVDPQKRAQLFDQLVTAKQEINKALTFFIGNTSYTSLQGRSGSAAYETYFGDLSLHKPFTSTQRETDDEIIRFANNIKNLSFEGQIQAEAELATKITDRAAAVRSAIEGIFQAFEDGAKKYRDAFESVDVLGFTRADGTVDQAGLSLYYKNKAQQDLEQERFASTPGRVTQFNDQFIKDIMAAGAASLAAGATAADVAKWEREQLTSGQGFFTAQLTKLGTDIDKLNDSFLTKLDPALTALYGSTSNLDTVIGNVGDHLGKIIDPIDRTGAGLDSVASSAMSVVVAFNAMIDRFNSASSSDFNSSISRLRASR